jgi:hypothetical protein
MYTIQQLSSAKVAHAWTLLLIDEKQLPLTVNEYMIAQATIKGSD